MNAFRLIISAGLLALLQACASLPGSQADIDAVLNASGLDAQLELLKQPLKTEKMEGPLAMIPDEWITLVNTTIAETLKPEKIRADLKQDLSEKLSSHELHDVQKFYESETGRTIVALESGKHGNAISISGISLATLDTLAEATGAGKAVSLLAERGLNEAIDIALKNGCFGLDKVPFAGMVIGVIKKSQLSALRQGINASLRQQYAYLLPADQSAYLAFAESSAGKKFLAARTRVMTNAAQQTGNALGSQLGQRISQVCTSTKV